MKRLIEQYPLATVLTIAVILRAISVVFAKGYMFSDDYYETVSVAYDWLRHGMFAPNGLLTWGAHTPGDIARFPLYTVFLYGIMWLYHAAGIDNLATMMFGVRAIHALISLLPVYAVYRIARMVTGSNRWAFLGGLIAAAHFAMPFLAVRTLIEMVGGYFWTFAIYYCYRYMREQPRHRYLIIAGILSGIAWMVRFQIVTAIVAIPLILLWQHRRLREAIIYSVTFLAMVVIAGFVDLGMLGGFLASTVHHLHQGFTETPPYKTSIFIYPAVLVAFFIPPLSIVLFVLAAFKRFWIEHKLLLSSLSFILIHSLVSARQERYMLPIVGAVMVLIVLVIWWQHEIRGFLFRYKRSFYALAAFTVSVNLILLVPFTIDYAHKGVVEPLVRIERLKRHPSVLFMTPERVRIFPFDYAGFDGLERRYINKWSDLDILRADSTLVDSIDYYIVYPNDELLLPNYLDSLQQFTGPLAPLYHIEPSLVDKLLHAVNSKHNPNDEVWVLTRRVKREG